MKQDERRPFVEALGAPGRLLAPELSCDYVGVDSSSGAVDLGPALPLRSRTDPAAASRQLRRGLLLETGLAFEDKKSLVEVVGRALRAGGRFPFAVEEGLPLTQAERTRMADTDTVWSIPLDEIHTTLARAGIVVRWLDDWSRSHHAVADAARIARQIGRRALDELLAAHRLWCEWLDTGRVRKLALVAERSDRPGKRWTWTRDPPNDG